MQGDVAPAAEGDTVPASGGAELPSLGLGESPDQRQQTVGQDALEEDFKGSVCEDVAEGHRTAGMDSMNRVLRDLDERFESLVNVDDDDVDDGEVDAVDFFAPATPKRVLELKKLETSAPAPSPKDSPAGGNDHSFSAMSPSTGSTSFAALLDIDERFESLLNISMGDVSYIAMQPHEPRSRDIVEPVEQKVPAAAVSNHSRRASADRKSGGLAGASQNHTDILPSLVRALNLRREWSLVSVLDLSGQSLTSLRGLEDSVPNLRRLTVDDNGISYLKGIPATVQYLSISGNRCVLFCLCELMGRVNYILACPTALVSLACRICIS